MLFLEVLVKFSAVGLLVMLAIMMLKDIKRSWPRRLLFLLCISLAALLIDTSSRELGLPDNIWFAARLLNVPNTILVWLFIKSLLDDEFKMGWGHWLITLLSCVPVFVLRFDVQGFFDIMTKTHVGMINIFSLGLFIYLMGFIIKGRADDLVEPRRRLRFYFVISTLLVTSVLIASEFVLTGPSVVIFKAALILPMLIIAYLWIFQLRPSHFAFGQNVLETDDKTLPKLQGREAKLYEKLLFEMTENKAWLEPDLTIPELARRVGVTEHTLRGLINQRLGFRNFSRFLNSYRIDEVKRAFAHPDTSDLPILTIALDAGFNSLPPFNRAFKAAEGMTPKAYKERLDPP